jgi:hypothetical protein
MIKHQARQDKIHVLSLDHVLAADICERLGDDARLARVELIVPGQGREGITVQHVADLAKETISSRVIILDVRSQTLARLQEPFNRVAGFNRGDLNERCFTIVIGDGPPKLFRPDTTLDVFAPLLAKCRIDYSPAAFFFDPFIHYGPDERVSFGLDEAGGLPTEIPRRLAHTFKGERVLVEDVRRYFRAAGAEAAAKEAAKRRRMDTLVRLYKKRLAEAFAERRREAYPWLSKEGYTLVDETLRVHLYPLYFEDWVADLIDMARTWPAKRLDPETGMVE